MLFATEGYFAGLNRVVFSEMNLDLKIEKATTTRCGRHMDRLEALSVSIRCRC
jgi:hypothetical protein